MKNLIFFLFVITIRISAQNYFPLQVGNRWTYCASFDTTIKRTYEIKDSVKFDNLDGFIYGVQNTLYNDTLFQDKSNNIYKIINSVPRLWFDFSQDSGTIYTIQLNDSISYFVHVKRNISVETYIGTFSDCIELFFDIPQIADEEITYVFAPNTGIVKIYGAWSNDVIFSLDIKDIPVSINNTSTMEENNFSLEQNYPNPFNPSTTINYSIGKSGNVKIIIYNSLGRKVKILLNEFKTSGNYQIKFNADNLASGIYYYRLISPKKIQTRSMILLK